MTQTLLWPGEALSVSLAQGNGINLVQEKIFPHRVGWIEICGELKEGKEKKWLETHVGHDRADGGRDLGEVEEMGK